jgi:plasmid maintenance system antidote protein VapI
MWVLSNILCKIAFRPAKVFGSTPEMWLNMQQAVDLMEANKMHNSISSHAISPSRTFAVKP